MSSGRGLAFQCVPFMGSASGGGVSAGVEVGMSLVLRRMGRRVRSVRGRARRCGLHALRERRGRAEDGGALFLGCYEEAEIARLLQTVL